jgi:para-nitrobenzyl esterase
MNRRDLLRNSLSVGVAALVGGQHAKPAAASGSVAASTTVETQYGKVRGASVQGVNIFRGIPYGGPSEGAARFLPPSKPAKWAGIRDATQTGPRCVQGAGSIFLNATIGEYFRGSRDRTELSQEKESENCLILNVLTPGLKGKRPVMIYIHGGGFSNLSSLLTLFADAFPREQDVVLVGINHRLSVFGYLYLGGLSDKYAVGNAGQLDLIAALEWVRDNISHFGGDPKNVTIFGESGGGEKISTLLAMPGAKGLFHRAIVESGSLLHVDDKETATRNAKTLLTKLGLAENQVDELQSVPAHKLLAAATGGGPMEYGPVVDGRSIPQQTWDPKAPEISVSIPMIIGNCKDESTLFSLQDEALFHLDEAGLRDRVVKAGIPESEVNRLLAAYHRDHPKDTPSDIYFRISTDRGARWNAVRQAELKIESGKASVYMYYFAWDTHLADGKVKAFHTAELPLAMRLVRYPESEQLSEQISGAWAAFARHGSPNRSGLPDWPAYSTTQRATMIFNAGKSEAADDPDGEERLMLRNRPSGHLL